MFTREKKDTRFDSISLVEVEAKQNPVTGAPQMRGRLCYVDSETGTTFGFLDFVHDPQIGLEVLSKDALDLWQKFCNQVEKDQGDMVFGSGSINNNPDQMGLFGKSDVQAESTEGPKTGLGGGS